MGLEKSYAKFCCFLCMWDSCARRDLYSKNCPLYKSHILRTKNIAHRPLVDPHKVLLPPVFIKLGLVKNSVKTLDRNGTAFSFMCEKFPTHSVERINPQGEVGLSVSSSVVPGSVALSVYNAVPVLVVYLCPSSVRVVATVAGTVLFPLLCSVPQFFR
jgi:hypothetical protein